MEIVVVFVAAASYTTPDRSRNHGDHRFLVVVIVIVLYQCRRPGVCFTHSSSHWFGCLVVVAVARIAIRTAVKNENKTSCWLQQKKATVNISMGEQKPLCLETILYCTVVGYVQRPNIRTVPWCSNQWYTYSCTFALWCC